MFLFLEGGVPEGFLVVRELLFYSVFEFGVLLIGDDEICMLWFLIFECQSELGLLWELISAFLLVACLDI